jgi:PAS domain-containing protein
MRTNAALGRLASLQKRAERATSGTAPVIKPALKELSDALEELRVANEQLHLQVEELTSARSELQNTAFRMTEFCRVLPVACLWTNAAGEIDEANPAAAGLLNVSEIHLAGRPMMLYLNDRQKFVEANTALNERAAGAVEFPVTVRPRERRPRTMRLSGHRLQHDHRTLWFLVDANGETEP